MDDKRISPDIVLACLLPICLFMVSLYWLGKPTLSLQAVLDIIQGRSKSHARHGYFSLERAVASYDQYLSLASDEIVAMRKSYGKLGRAHKRIGYDLGYTTKLNRLEAATATNADLTRVIASCARDAFPQLWKSRLVNEGDLARVRETLKHFVRDWSTEGEKERKVFFGPVLEALQLENPQMRNDMKVLIPGSGLGRLAWEVSELGYNTTANELSFFMTLAYRFLLSPTHTISVNQHIIHPYSYWFSHQLTNDNLFRGVSFPDAIPRLSNKLHLVEGDFLTLHAPEEGYDYIVTLFFIDTSLNAISTIEHIHKLLRPGGKWINLGPLLWPGGAQACVELSLDEVLKLADIVGFYIEDGPDIPEAYRRKTVSCEYTADQRAMMTWLYQAEFWVATKVCVFAK